MGRVAVAILAIVLAWSATLKFEAPAGWVVKPPASSMRIAEFTLPKVEGDPEDAELAIFYFGPTQGGTVQANLSRWIGQMTQPDGRPSADVAKTSTFTSHGLNVTLVDISGTYVAEVTPGSSDHFNKPAFRQCAAVVETDGGPYFVKLTGPEKTVAKWNDSFTTFLRTLRYE